MTENLEEIPECSRLEGRDGGGHRRPEAVTHRCTAERNPFLHPLELLEDFGPEYVELGFARTGLRNSLEAMAGEELLWRLVHTRPRQEKKLAQELKSMGVSHFLPATECQAITRGRSRSTWAPLFPGYLFLYGNEHCRLHALKTNRTVAIHSVEDQRFLGSQLHVLAGLIENQVALRLEERLVVGDKVRVKVGPLRGLSGMVIKRSGRTRLFVQVMDLLGGVSLEVDPHLLERA